MKKALLIIFFILSASFLAAQSFDGGLLVGAEAQKSVRSWTFSIGGEIRTNQWVTIYDRGKLQADIGYSCWQKRIKISIGYDYINKHSQEDAFYHRHRVNLSLGIGEKFGRFKLSYRAKFQTTFYDIQRESVRFNPKIYMRNRVELTYSFYGKPVKLFCSGEFFWRLYHPDKNIIDEVRVIAGVDYKVRKGHTLSFFLRSDNEVQVKAPEYAVYLGIGYKFAK
ncbi:MAG: DUF2490 domain-containing protein [Bacteroidales bacterium]|nr:DUF2490 domain-containing protein [Bacteroidales bacterium]